MDIKILEKDYPRGRLTSALFDFDGTLSLIRYGWEEVMQELMEEMIVGESGEVPQALKREVEEYIDESTGVLTIRQMEWLAKAVGRWKMNETVLSAAEYKKIYNERLLSTKVNDRLAVHPLGGIKENLLLEGSFDFLKVLFSKGVKLYLASGTDDAYVQREAAFLGIRRFFSGRVYGAVDDSESSSKEEIIRKILREDIDKEGLLMVLGDGPVEIKAARDFGALAVGVASDEERRRGWNSRKIERLSAAGAHILIPDFSSGEDLLQIMT